MYLSCLKDPSFWILISFILLLLSFAKYIFQNLNQTLTRRQETISRQISEVSALYEEAKSLLLSEQENLKKKQAEIEELESETLQEIRNKKRELEDSLAKIHEKYDELLKQKINSLEKKYYDELTKNLLKKSCDLAEIEIKKSLTSKTSSTLITQEIERLKL